MIFKSKNKGVYGDVKILTAGLKTDTRIDLYI